MHWPISATTPAAMREFAVSGVARLLWRDPHRTSAGESGLLKRRRFASQAEARMAWLSYIEGWYNPIRLHSGLGYRSPVAYEAEGEQAINEP